MLSVSRCTDSNGTIVDDDLEGGGRVFYFGIRLEEQGQPREACFGNRYTGRDSNKALPRNLAARVPTRLTKTA